MNTYPFSYQSVSSFFAIYGMPQSLILLDKLLHYAVTGETWPGKFPANAVSFADSLSQLANCAFEIVSEPAGCTDASLHIKTAGPLWQLTQYETYCGRHPASTPWHFFPRSLTQKEFCNPCKALRKFTRSFSQENWGYVLKDILLAALSPQRIQDLNDEYNILLIRQHLHKLIEACHLISIRIPGEET